MVAIRKFSPCGRYLVTFSRTRDEHALRVFTFLPGFRPEEDEFPSNLWSHYFKLRFEITFEYLLNKDFCLFTRDARHVLIASTHTTTVPDPEEHMRHYPEALKAGTPNLEDISIYSVDMETGTVCSKKEFVCCRYRICKNNIQINNYQSYS